MIKGKTKQNDCKQKRESNFPVEWAFEVAQEYHLFTDWLITGKGPKKLDDCHEKSEKLLTGYIAEWISEQSKSDPNFSQNFQTDCALAFPEFAKWLKKRKKTV